MKDDMEKKYIEMEKQYEETIKILEAELQAIKLEMEDQIEQMRNMSSSEIYTMVTKIIAEKGDEDEVEKEGDDSKKISDQNGK